MRAKKSKCCVKNLKKLIKQDNSKKAKSFLPFQNGPKVDLFCSKKLLLVRHYLFQRVLPSSGENLLRRPDYQGAEDRCPEGPAHLPWGLLSGVLPLPGRLEPTGKPPHNKHPLPGAHGPGELPVDRRLLLHRVQSPRNYVSQKQGRTMFQTFEASFA